jgi:hypothetical protein
VVTVRDGDDQELFTSVGAEMVLDWGIEAPKMPGCAGLNLEESIARMSLSFDDRQLRE